MPDIITKKIKDVYGNHWNEVAHKTKCDFKIIGHTNGYITLQGRKDEIDKFIEELNK